MLEALLLVLSLSVDACTASFAYGTNKIKIPFASSIVLTLISTLFLLISLGLGCSIQNFLSPDCAKFLCFSILLILGFLRLFEGMLKNYLNQKAVSSHNIEVTLFNFKLVLNVYADATLADIDHSKTLSIKEALYLGIALSLDSLVVGIGAGLLPISLKALLLLSILINLAAIYLGSIMGRLCAKKVEIDLSWLGGVILIVLALLKLL